MPCNDVTELLSLTLDAEDRLIHYSLTKFTCGGDIGSPSLLKKWIANKPATEILQATGDMVLEALPTISTTWEYMTLKHLAAVQFGLQAFLGKEPARPNDICVIESVHTTEKGVQMIALIKVDMMTSRITACGGCGTCSTGEIKTDGSGCKKAS